MNDNAIDCAANIAVFTARARGLLGAFRKYALPEDRDALFMCRDPKLATDTAQALYYFAPVLEALTDDLNTIEEYACALREEVATHAD
jgi:hypothetical protein